MVDQSGRVDLADYHAYVADLVEDMNRKETMLDNKAMFYKSELGRQINAAISFNAGIQAYYEATGISDQTFADLLEQSRQLIDTTASTVGKVQQQRDARQAVEEAIKEEKRDIRGAGLLEFLRRIQASRQQGGVPINVGDIQRLLDTLRGKPLIPETPPTQP